MVRKERVRKRRTQNSRYPSVCQDSVHNVWPPFSEFCTKEFELVVLNLLFRSMFSSGVRLSMEWELSSAL